MRFFHLAMAFLLILGVETALAAESGRPFKVSVLYWSMNIPGQVAMRKGLEAEAESINESARSQGLRSVELRAYVAGDGPDGVEKQISQMREAIALRPDILIVQPTDNAALAAPLREANRAGIPVVAYDQYISGGKLAAYVTSDNRQAGYLGGEYLATTLAGKAPLRLVLVEYPLVSSTVERLNGFLDALRDHGKPFKILKTYQAVEPEAGRRVGQEILRDFPTRKSIDAIFAVNDGGGLSVVEALANAGRDEIAVATVDGDPLSVANIRAKRLSRIDSAQFCGPLGATAMKVAHAILRGQKVASHILVPVFPITAETLARYPGWQGPVPASFEKPWPAKQRMWKGELTEVRQ